MAAGSRRVVWSASAEAALDEILGHIAKTSTDGMARVLVRALDTAQSLDRFAERGRVVEEIGDPTLRELLVYDYRMLYRVHAERVVIEAFLHGARDFATWRREAAPEL